MLNINITICRESLGLAYREGNAINDICLNICMLVGNMYKLNPSSTQLYQLRKLVCSQNKREKISHAIDYFHFLRMKDNT